VVLALNYCRFGDWGRGNLFGDDFLQRILIRSRIKKFVPILFLQIEFNDPLKSSHPKKALIFQKPKAPHLNFKSTATIIMQNKKTQKKTIWRRLTYYFCFYYKPIISRFTTSTTNFNLHCNDRFFFVTFQFEIVLFMMFLLGFKVLLNWRLLLV
jgi:hypothetical protein